MLTNANLYGTGNSAEAARTAKIDREKDGDERGAPPNELVGRYNREVERYNRVTSSWYDEGDQIVQVYMDEAESKNSRRFALLWSNVETLKPAVYTRIPSVLCSRRYKDRDPVARKAAELMERACNTSFELYGIDEVFRMVRDDRLLPGRGTAWVRYEAQIESYEEKVTEFDAEAEADVERTEVHDRLRSEKVCVDHVFWQDFGHNVVRIWKDVWLVWRIVYKTQDEVAERFGGKVSARLSYNSKAPSGDNGAAPNGGEGEHYCKIYEFWDKQRNLVSWMADGDTDFLESGEPPVDFANFFPCPEPCYSTKTSKSLIPRPDYCYYRDQAKEINDLTAKIANLTEWLIVKGFIPGGPSSLSDPIEEVLRDKGNREMFVQIEDWSKFSDQGGSAKLVDWLPLQPVVAALQAAIQARQQLIQDVYQISGIGDVMRGQTDPGETYGAVELRAQTGSRRLRNTKDDLARFCKDIAKLTAEVIAEKFEPESIAEITGFKYIPPVDPLEAFRAQLMPDMANVTMFPGMGQMPAGVAAPGMQVMGGNGGPSLDDEDGSTDPALTFDDEVMALLRNDRMRSFRVDIETDSTVQADENAERRSRTEFVSAAGEFLERAARIVQTAPDMAGTAGELLMFAVRSFRPGRALEETMERDFANMVKRGEAARNQPPQKDPIIQVAEVQVQGEIEKNRADAALKAKDMQTDAELEIREQNIDAAVKIRQQDMNATAKTRETASRMLSSLGYGTTR